MLDENSINSEALLTGDELCQKLKIKKSFQILMPKRKPQISWIDL